MTRIPRKKFAFHLPFAGIALCSAILFLNCINDRLTTARDLLESGDYLAARDIYARVLEKHPDNFAAHYGLGMSWCAEAMYKTEIGLALPEDWYPAIYQMTIAAHITPHPETRRTLAILHFNLGTSFNKQGASAEAVKRIQQAVAYDSSLFKAWNLLGALSQEQGDLATAETCYRRAIIIKPDYAMSHFNLGALTWARKEFEQAEKHFQDAVTLEPGNAYFVNWLERTRQTVGNGAASRGKR